MTGLYVHIPFCSVKCFYCDFTAFAGQKKTARRYLAALEAEAGLFPESGLSTLYVGGGTPSELEPEELTELFALIGRAYPNARFEEATCEANPESLSPEKLEILRRGGINRLSLGLQTTDDALLKSIGRRHTAQDFFEVYAAARRAGGFAISIDLMYGLPGQSPQSCRESLEAALKLKPEHFSLYGLQVEDRTLFAKRGVEADEDRGREMFESSLEIFAAAGYRHYEISNFALPGFESKHNQIYWDDGEYVGLGCGASSHRGGRRSTNIDRLGEYCDKALAGQPPIDSSEKLAGKEKLGETIYLGLRKLDGLSLTPEMESQFAPQWSALAGSGLIEREGARVRLTREGVFLANDVSMHFVAPL